METKYSQNETIELGYSRGGWASGRGNPGFNIMIRRNGGSSDLSLARINIYDLLCNTDDSNMFRRAYNYGESNKRLNADFFNRTLRLRPCSVNLRENNHDLFEIGLTACKEYQAPRVIGLRILPRDAFSLAREKASQLAKEYSSQSGLNLQDRTQEDFDAVMKWLNGDRKVK